MPYILPGCFEFVLQDFTPELVKVSKSIETVAQMCSKRKVFLEISQNSQENTCARVSILIKLQAWGLQETLHRCFPAKFLRKHLRWLLLRRPNYTIQRTSNSLAKAHLRISFLQNSSQWLPSNVSYFFFQKREKQTIFHTSSDLNTLEIL